MIDIVVATGNVHKLEEYQSLLSEFRFASLADFPPMDDVDESFPDFARNAALKATAAYEHTGRISVADDSGLEVSALNGAPGVRSKRYAPGSDRDRYEKLLSELEGVSDRRARFVCAIALAGIERMDNLGPGLIACNGCVVALGYVSGHISTGPRGTNGFGYDPVFELSDGRTMAELLPSEKQAVSHRGNAVKIIKPWMVKVFH